MSVVTEAAVAKKQKKPEPPENHERWLVSYADYMTLLFALFVVLYSFAMAKQSEYNALVKAFMDSMGKVGLISRPAGSPVLDGGTGILEKQVDVSVETKEETDTTPINAETKPIIEVQNVDLNVGNSKISAPEDLQQSETAAYISKQKDQKELVGKLREKLDAKRIEVEQLGQQVVIRIKDNTIFPSGSANLQPQFRPIIAHIATVLKDIPGVISVTGHTDDQIEDYDSPYQSNWELSSLRAVAVVSEILKSDGMKPERIIAQGRADTVPLVPNSSVENRAKNRRIEISIVQGTPDNIGTVDPDAKPASSSLKSLEQHNEKVEVEIKPSQQQPKPPVL